MQDRVVFLKQCAQLMQSKGRIKLNTKRLYQADGYAVKELIKIANVLYDAIKSNPDDEDDIFGTDNFSLKLNDLKDIRDLATEITQHGAALAELLGREEANREARQRAISRNAEVGDIEKVIKQQILAARDTMANKEKMMEELLADEKSLKKKIEKKSVELDRNEKRFRSLQTVRPAFMDEYEKLEDQLQDLFRDYLERYRNLDYIDNLLDQHNKEEQEKIDENERRMKKMQKKIKEEEMRVLRGDVQLDENELDDSLLDDASSDEEQNFKRGGSSEGERPKTKSGPRSNVQGTLTGGDESNSASDQSSSDVDSGELLDVDSDQDSNSGNSDVSISDDGSVNSGSSGSTS
uniref:Clusterin-associated protein 1 n=1 Tax=Guillardia theta TaxID=55529 RepID=A0A7S4JSD5_GUITH